MPSFDRDPLSEGRRLGKGSIEAPTQSAPQAGKGTRNSPLAQTSPALPLFARQTQQPSEELGAPHSGRRHKGSLAAPPPSQTRDPAGGGSWSAPSSFRRRASKLSFLPGEPIPIRPDTPPAQPPSCATGRETPPHTRDPSSVSLKARKKRLTWRRKPRLVARASALLYPGPSRPSPALRLRG